MSEQPEPPPDRPTVGALPGQPLLEGLSARRLVADMLASSGSLTPSPDWEAPTPESLASLLHGYEVHRLLGRGGMGAVYLATESRLGRQVAIKLLPPELGQRPDFRQRFEREGWVLAQLDHPHIVRLYGLGESEAGHLYLVMEYIDGTNLADLMRETRAAMEPGRPVVPWPRCVEIITQLCEALVHAHAQGLIHRDLKPANVLITRDGTVKLADFGLARPILGSRGRGGEENRVLLTQTGQVMGTYDYMAPEQRDGLPGDHRVDVYGVGVLMYQMLTGCLPRGAFSPPSATAGTAPEVDRLVLRALANSVDDRTPSVEALRDELLMCTAPGAPPWLRKPGWRAAAAAFGTAGVLLAAWLAQSGWLQGNRDPEPHSVVAAPPGAARPLAAATPIVEGARRSSFGHVMRPLDAFRGVHVSESETTVGQYRRFVEETGRPASPAQRPGSIGDPLAETLTWEAPGRSVTEDEPVVGVSWNDAHDFCHWLTRRARSAGEIQPGEEYRLPRSVEWQDAALARAKATPGTPSLRVEEWLLDPATFNRPWHFVRTARSAAEGQPASTATAGAVHDGGTTARGFRLVLDVKTAELLPVSRSLWAVAEAWGGWEQGRAPVEVLAVPNMAKINLVRRPDITDLTPLKSLQLTEFWAAPTRPMDLTPLAGQPIRLAYLAGPVASLEPFEGSPLEQLSLGEFGAMPPSGRRPLPSLAPLADHRRLTHLSWRCVLGSPDVPLREFPRLREFAVWDCDLDSLQFLEGSAIPDVTIDRTGIADSTGWHHTRRLRKLERAEHLFVGPDQLAHNGDLAGALQSLEALEMKWADARWFDANWEATIARRKRNWSSWQANGIAGWMAEGAIGPPPGSMAFRGRWFYFLELPMARAEAEELAAQWGGYLATLADPEEEAFVRTHVLPPPPEGLESDRRAVDVHLGAWRGSPTGPWRWVTGEPWRDDPARDASDSPPSAFLTLRTGEARWRAERPGQSAFPALIEWGEPSEEASLRALEKMLPGSWVLEDGVVLELGPRGQLGPRPIPGSRWWIVDAARRMAVVSRYFGKNRLAFALTDDADVALVTRHDGVTVTAARQQ